MVTANPLSVVIRKFHKTQQNVSGIEGISQLLDEAKISEAKKPEGATAGIINLGRFLKKTPRNENKAYNFGFVNSFTDIRRENKIFQQLPLLYGCLLKGGGRSHW